jgi:hypothetical protein
MMFAVVPQQFLSIHLITVNMVLARLAKVVVVEEVEVVALGKMVLEEERTWWSIIVFSIRESKESSSRNRC